MALSDPLGDLLARVKNGQMARLQVVSSPSSKLRNNVLDVLKREGFIRDYNVTKSENGQDNVDIELKYQDGQPVIRELNRISKPSRRVYSKIADLQAVYNGLGIAILSTPKGVMSDHEARAANVGGEVLCRVF
jgi:small subunit ribosomal protein S8